MTVKKKEFKVVELSTSQTFGTTGSVYPEWKAPVTISHAREFEPETENWDRIISLEMGNVKMVFTFDQWKKLEEFVKHTDNLMENV